MSISRIRILSLSVLLVAALIVTRLFYVQIVHGKEYSDNADRQYAVPYGNVFDRGSIFFTQRGGSRISAATLENGYLMAIKPQEIKDASTTLNQLSSVISISEDTFIFRANKKNDPYEEIAHHISKEDADKISALKLPGVSLYK